MARYRLFHHPNSEQLLTMRRLLTPLRDWLDSLSSFCGGRKFSYCLSQSRVNRMGRQFRQGNERECPDMQPRVGNFEVGQLDNGVTIQKDVQIYQARTPSNSRLPPQSMLHHLAGIQQFIGFQRRRHLGDRVQKGRLVGHSPRLRLVDLGLA